MFVTFEQYGDDNVAITVTSHMLSEIDRESPGAAVAYNRLEELNRQYLFLKFVMVDMLVVACDLLGNHLHSTELLNAVYGVGGAAARLEDDLLEEIGGKTYEMVLAEQVTEYDLDDD